MPQMPAAPTWHVPVPDLETEPYWQAARQHRLLIKQCNGCGRPFFYPRAACPRCWSLDTGWRYATGRGSVYTFTVVHQNDLPPFRDRLPYVVAIVELEEGVRMTSNIEGISPEDVRCGMDVVVDWREEGSMTVPVFRPA